MLPASILCVGTSHWLATVALLEEAAAGAEAVRRTFADAILRERSDALPLRELAILSTCNRVEIWGSCDPEGRDGARALLSTAFAGTPAYVHEDSPAVRHLCRVAAGLESMIVGEPEIAGQVAHAFRHTLRRGDAPSLLHGVARAAQAASRRARAETRISRGPASVSSVAVRMAAEEIGGLAGRRVLLLGAGRIGGLVAAALRGSGAAIVVANRTAERAQELAARIGCTHAPLDALPSQLACADVLIASTAARRSIVSETMVRRALEGREPLRPLVIVDIAVPRNVDPAVSDVAGVRLLGIDDLRERIAVHVEERKDEIPAVEAIVDEEVMTWQRRRHGEGVVPLIAELRGRAERIRRREVERLLADLGGRLDPDDRARIEHFSRSIVNRLLHEPVTRLRDPATADGVEVQARVARELFGLDERSGTAGRDA